MIYCYKHKIFSKFMDNCSECLHELAKAEKAEKKAESKRNSLIAKHKLKNQEPKGKISKNPKDWKNTFLCSDGTKVTEAEINNRYSGHRAHRQVICEGCHRSKAVCKAHIIAKARCKQIGKTELIWDYRNMYDSCYPCNAAIENPKAKAWKSLKNIDYCLSFIKEHDPELFTKFELAAIDQSRLII